jgi:NADPH-dependent F420 reductase
MTDVSAMTVAVLGGTGDQGQGLAYRFARAGIAVIIGSRDAERAGASALELTAKLAEIPAAGRIEGLGNADAASRADVVVIAVPWAAHEPTILALTAELAGKIVVDCVNPLGFDERGPFVLPVAEGSAAEQAQRLLPDSRVIGAFHNVSAVTLADPDVTDLDQDVLVLGEDRAATDIVQSLADVLPGVRGIYGGRLRNVGQIEALTANLIAINRRYKGHAGIRITGF